MDDNNTLKKTVEQLLAANIPNDIAYYSRYITDQLERDGKLLDYLDINNRAPELQKRIIEKLRYDPRKIDRFQSLLEEAIQLNLGLKDACQTWLSARLNTKTPIQFRRAVEKLCKTISWTVGKDLKTGHLSWLKKAKREILLNK